MALQETVVSISLRLNILEVIFCNFWQLLIHLNHWQFQPMYKIRSLKLVNKGIVCLNSASVVYITRGKRNPADNETASLGNFLFYSNFSSAKIRIPWSWFKPILYQILL